jgi:hypothetical protein
MITPPMRSGATSTPMSPISPPNSKEGEERDDQRDQHARGGQSPGAVLAMLDLGPSFHEQAEGPERQKGRVQPQPPTAHLTFPGTRGDRTSGIVIESPRQIARTFTTHGDLKHS